MLTVKQHELLVLGPSINSNVYEATFLSTVAATTLVAWDAVLALEDEVDYIWSNLKTPGRAHVKWVYLFARWFGFLNQIGILIWQCFVGTHGPVTVSTCEVVYIFAALTFQILQLCLNAILILQIRALYQGQRRYMVTALAFVLLEGLASIATQAISIPRATVDGTCMTLRTPWTTTVAGIGMVVSQIVALSLTFRGKALLQPVARHSKLITVVVRDGIFGFGVVIGIVLMGCLYFLFNQIIINVFFPWMPAVPAILTPRMILNMQAAARAPADFTLEFTTMPSDAMQLSVAPRRDVAVVHE